MCYGQDAVVIYQLLDNTLFMARTEDGGLIPIRKGLDGHYHVDGDICLAPAEIQFHVFKALKPLLDLGGQRLQILVTPIPRYATARCCEDKDHMPNFFDEDYRKIMDDALFASRKLAKDYAFTLRLRSLRVVSPLKELRQLGDEVLWRDDPVHLSPAGYRCIAVLLKGVVEELADRRGEGGHKRSREDEDGGAHSRRGTLGDSGSGF